MFAGGFDLGAVAAVFCCRNDSAAHDLADLLAGKSLVVAEPAADGSRYRLLETIRQYAAERLAEAEQARRRHAGTFLARSYRHDTYIFCPDLRKCREEPTFSAQKIRGRGQLP